MTVPGEAASGEAASGEAASGQAAPRESTVRAELRDWIAACWDPELSLAQWRALLADSGWACPA